MRRSEQVAAEGQRWPKGRNFRLKDRLVRRLETIRCYCCWRTAPFLRRVVQKFLRHVHGSILSWIITTLIYNLVKQRSAYSAKQHLSSAVHGCSYSHFGCYIPSVKCFRVIPELLLIDCIFVAVCYMKRSQCVVKSLPNGNRISKSCNDSTYTRVS